MPEHREDLNGDLRDRVGTAVLEAFQRVCGKPRNRWHTQRVHVAELTAVQDGWRARVSISEDLDNCSQYDRTADWGGVVDILDDEPVLHVRGQVELIECGVAHGARAEAVVLGT